MRIKLIEPTQREFIELCKNKLNWPNVFSILQFGIDCSVSSLKNYYTQRRLLPQDVFDELCYLTKIDKNGLNFELISDNWGQIKGGKKHNK